MKQIRNIGLIFSFAFIAGCSSSSSTPPTYSIGVASNAGGAYTVTTLGTTHTIDGTKQVIGNRVSWLDGSMKAVGYDNLPNVLALAGVYQGSNEAFAGIIGVLSSAPTAGTATYKGDFLTTYVNSAGNLNSLSTNSLNLNVDFGAGTLSGSGGPGVYIDATITGNEFTGTVQLPTSLTQTPSAATMKGGFFTNDTIAGAFVGDGKAGVFGGVKQP